MAVEPGHHAPVPRPGAPGAVRDMLTVEELEREIGQGGVDTVVAAFTDMQGHLSEFAKRCGELFLASQAMLLHVLRLRDDLLTVNGTNILAFEVGIDWDVARVRGGTAGMLAGGLFNIHLRGTGRVALVSDGEPLRLDVSEAPPSLTRRQRSPGRAALRRA